MSKPIPFESEGEIIDVSPRRPRRPRRWWWLVLAGVALLFLASRALSIYISALWFGSLGYSSVYWYMFRLKIELFVIFFVLTVLILRGERATRRGGRGPRPFIRGNIRLQPRAENPRLHYLLLEGLPR